MRLRPPLVWERPTREKLRRKHQVSPQEVEEVFFADRPHFKRYQQVYHAYGQTLRGRYLFVVFRQLARGQAKPITAYQMTEKQQRYYRHVKGGN